jgi:hypothetical protein
MKAQQLDEATGTDLTLPQVCTAAVDAGTAVALFEVWCHAC